MRNDLLPSHRLTIAVRYLLVLALSVLVPILLAAEPANTAATAAPAVKRPQPSTQPAATEREGKQDAPQEQFTPTEKIGADSVVSFPVDI